MVKQLIGMKYSDNLLQNMNGVESSLATRIKQFMENEARSCSMNFGCITPLYVYRMWGEKVPLKDIEEAFQKMSFDQ